jgi:enterochelin esterase-like enzyme
VRTPAPDAPPSARPWTRRRVLTIGLGGAAAVVVAGAAGFELVDHGVLPGKNALDELDGACAVPSPRPVFGTPGPTVTGRFFSRARNRTVGYAIAYPPGRGPGAALPLVVALHAYGGSYAAPLSGMSMAQALALRVGGRALTPMAMVSADGGGGYWNPHPGDDPMGMVVDELIPMVQRRGLGRAPDGMATLGISMGGYGAVLLAERHPRRFAAVAAISPAIWTSYPQARGANPGAYASAADFAADDAVTHAAALHGVSVRVASGDDDPFHPGVEALAAALPAGSQVVFAAGCHSGPFFTSQVPPSLAFVSAHLAPSGG